MEKWGLRLQPLQAGPAGAQTDAAAGGPVGTMRAGPAC